LLAVVVVAAAVTVVVCGAAAQMTKYQQLKVSARTDPNIGDLRATILLRTMCF